MSSCPNMCRILTGLQVTWKLRPNVLWSDGTLFTSKDVYFTWNALRQSGIFASGFDLITDIDMPDKLTAVVHYSRFYPNYRLQFGGEGTGIFPAHYCGDVANMLRWECNSKPISTGPFILAEQENEQLIFTPNPYYWKPNRPLAQQLIFIVNNNAEYRVGMLKRETGYLDLWTQADELDIAQDIENITMFATNPPRFMLRLVPNLSAFGTADSSQPHHIFTDVDVRRAVRHAINVPQIIDTVFDNRAVIADTELDRHRCEVSRYNYNPAVANALLSQVGWFDEDGDGIRECHGCQFAVEGTPLTFESYYYEEFGNPLAQVHYQIVDMLAEVGIEMIPKKIEGINLWDTWMEDGIEMRGNFSMNLWDDGYYGIDPTDYLFDMYDPRAIPTENDPLAGFNVMRYRNLSLIAIFDELYMPIPDTRRQQRICQLATILYRDLPVIPLLAFPDIYLINTRLQGVYPHIYDTVTWNAEDWYLEE